MKPYSLEERTLGFARAVLYFCRFAPKTITNVELVKQVARSAGSVGANYIEATQAISRKDFFLRAKICRKEAKETAYWLKLIEASDRIEKQRQALISEAEELTRIFGAIIRSQE